MALLNLSLLGDYQMHDASGTLVTLSAKKSQALLAYLGVRPTQLVSRDKIANLLWSSTGPEQARQSLRQLLSSLRKELGNVSSKEKILVEEADFLGVD
ncbi:MAG: winged helix-turn-helix domain-containing protein, partial [Acidobacteria bacterium]|nr:winged helix-turn-helix domain-containing protein [Acidobacteriota bacterium]